MISQNSDCNTLFTLDKSGSESEKIKPQANMIIENRTNINKHPLGMNGSQRGICTSILIQRLLIALPSAYLTWFSTNFYIEEAAWPELPFHLRLLRRSPSSWQLLSSLSYLHCKIRIQRCFKNLDTRSFCAKIYMKRAVTK